MSPSHHRAFGPRRLRGFMFFSWRCRFVCASPPSAPGTIFFGFLDFCAYFRFLLCSLLFSFGFLVRVQGVAEVNDGSGGGILGVRCPVFLVFFWFWPVMWWWLESRGRMVAERYNDGRMMIACPLWGTEPFSPLLNT